MEFLLMILLYIKNNQLKNEITYIDSKKIKLKNLEINENGLIKGYDFKNYETALDSFMELLKKIRRNV